MKDKTLTIQAEKPKRGGSKSGRKFTRLSLSTIGGVIKEAGAIYRAVKSGKLDHEQGRSLVWMLAQLRTMLEGQLLEEMHAKLSQVSQQAEARDHGYIALPASRLPH
jgi:hypothetical protein